MVTRKWPIAFAAASVVEGSVDTAPNLDFNGTAQIKRNTGSLFLSIFNALTQGFDVAPFK